MLKQKTLKSITTPHKDTIQKKEKNKTPKKQNSRTNKAQQTQQSGSGIKEMYSQVKIIHTCNCTQKRERKPYNIIIRRIAKL